MPEAGTAKDPVVEATDRTARAAREPTAGAASAGERKPRGHWFFYGLGLSVQTLLWFLLFLAIMVAVLVGGKLTEFRYVGF